MKNFLCLFLLSLSLNSAFAVNLNTMKCDEDAFFEFLPLEKHYSQAQQINFWTGDANDTVTATYKVLSVRETALGYEFSLKGNSELVVFVPVENTLSAYFQDGTDSLSFMSCGFPEPLPGVIVRY